MMQLRDGFREIVSGWTLISGIDDLTDRIERAAEWTKTNGPLTPDEQATISLMIEAQIVRGMRYEGPVLEQALNEADMHCLASGLCAMSVCVPDTMSREDVQRVANLKNPTGISSRWTISEASHFASGETNPCACEQEPGRTHYLLEC